MININNTLISGIIFNLVYELLLIHFAFSQNPSTISLNSNISISEDTYIRATQKISLKPGFKYSALSPASPLLNLSIGNNPPYVNSFYGNSATFPQNTSDYCNYSGINPQSASTNLAVGETGGSFNVNGYGDINYSIPIYTPKGGGLSPNISISYSGFVTNGYLGKGFTLKGLSEIKRVPKDVKRDGINRRVMLDNNDVFALNGNRLYALNGSYGSSNTTYYTEEETFYNIQSFGTQGNGPAYFIVKDKAGNIYEYGKSFNAQLTGESDNTVLKWYINKIIDKYGNYMEFHYQSLNGETVIDYITYTGNINNGLLPYNKISFDYYNRSDKSFYFINGKKFNVTKLLKSITCYAEGQIVRKYELNYIWDNVSLLASVKEIGKDGSYFMPTTFCWKDRTELFPESKTNTAQYVFPSNCTGLGSPACNYYANLIKMIHVDLNGDGFADIVAVYSDRIRIYLNKYLAYNLQGPPASSYLNYDYELVLNNHAFQNAFVDDENYDNYQELYLSYIASGNIFRVYKITFNGSFQFNTILSKNPVPSLMLDPTFSEISYFYYDATDHTGDGKKDRLIITGDEVKMEYLNSVYTEPISAGTLVKPIDFNGDGATDLAYLSQNGMNVDVLIKKQVFNNNVVSFQTTQNFSLPNTNLYSIDFGDLNADGITDLVYADNLTSANINYSSLKVMYSNGINFLPAKNVSSYSTPPSSFQNYYVKVSDINSDNIKDILVLGKNYNSIQQYAAAYSSIGNILFKTTETTEFLNNYFIFYEGINYDIYPNSDINGDGVSDFYKQSFAITPYHAEIDITLSKSGQNKLISKITTGLGNTLELKYGNLKTGIRFSGNNFYYQQPQTFYVNTCPYPYPELSLPTDATAPLYNYRLNLPVIIESTYSHPIIPAAKTSTKYFYGDIAYQPNGNGFIGFRRNWTVNNNTMLGTNIYSYVEPTYKILLPLESSDALYQLYTTYQNPCNSEKYYNIYLPANNGLLSAKTKWTYNTQQVNFNSFVIQLTNTDSRDYEKSMQTISTYQYDINLANAVTHKEVIYTWPGKPISRKEIFDYNYITINTSVGNENVTSIQLNLQTTTQVQNNSINTQADEFPFTIQTQYNYDSQAHLISEIQGYNTFWPLTTTYSNFDAFGHPLSKTITGYDIPSATYQYVYEPKGRFLIQTINPAGQIEEYTYDNEGNTLSYKNTNNLITTYEYDGFGNLIKTTSPEGITAVNKREFISLNSILSSGSNNIKPYTYAPFSTGSFMFLIREYLDKPFTPKVFNYYLPTGLLLRTEKETFTGNNAYKDIIYNWTNNQLPYGLKLREELYYHYGTTDSVPIKEYNYTPPSPSSPVIRLESDKLKYHILNNNAYSPIDITTPTNPYLNTTQTFYFYNNFSTDNNYIPPFIDIRNNSTNFDGTRQIIKWNTAGQKYEILQYNVYYAPPPGATQNTPIYRTNYYFHSSGKPYLIYSRDTVQYSTQQKKQKIHISYDQYARKIMVQDDGNRTQYFWSYNTLGQTIQEINLFGIIDYTYDNLGRMLTKTASTYGTATYQYETSANGKGLIKKITDPNSSIEYTYDNLNRVIKIQQTVDNQNFITEYTYNNMGKINSRKFPNGVTIFYIYDAKGYLTTIKDNNNRILWQIQDMGPEDEITKYELYKNITTYQKYTPFRNVKELSYYYNNGYNNYLLMKQENIWNDASGNIEKRALLNNITEGYFQYTFNTGPYTLSSVAETYDYDPVTGGLSAIQPADYFNGYSPTTSNPLNITYDTLANITHKYDAGDYIYNMFPNAPYHPPYMLTQINNPQPALNTNKIHFSYNDFSKPASIEDLTLQQKTDIFYTESENRIKAQHYQNNNLQWTRYYLKDFDVEIKNGQTRSWAYVASPSGWIATYYTPFGSTQPILLSVIRDHQGSALAHIEYNPADNTGNQDLFARDVVAYTPWGRYDSSFISYSGFTGRQHTIRGYTGHEELSEYGFINMNARIYDPVVARFMQPDNINTDASSPAGFNRFTYANNNPLSGKDIDGNRPLYSGIRTREFYESTSKSLMPQYMSLLETQSQIYNAEQSTLNQFIQESIITNPFETPYDLYIDGIRVRSGTAGYNMLMDWAMRGRTDMLGAVTIATYGGLSTNSGVVYDMGALLDIAIENYQQEIIELQTAASKAQSKEELEETTSRPYFDTGQDPPGGKKKKAQGGGGLSGPRSFANELKYYYKYNSGTDYHLSPERFNDVYEQAHQNNAIEWDKATRLANGIYSIPVNFYKTDYDFAFGRATLYFSFDQTNGFKPIGFFDVWDLDPKPWGIRSIMNEVITRYYNWQLDGGTSFKIVYP